MRKGLFAFITQAPSLNGMCPEERKVTQAAIPDLMVDLRAQGAAMGDLAGGRHSPGKDRPTRRNGVCRRGNGYLSARMVPWALWRHRVARRAVRPGRLQRQQHYRGSLQLGLCVKVARCLYLLKI